MSCDTDDRGSSQPRGAHTFLLRFTSSETHTSPIVLIPYARGRDIDVARVVIKRFWVPYPMSVTFLSAPKSTLACRRPSLKLTSIFVSEPLENEQTIQSNSM